MKKIWDIKFTTKLFMGVITLSIITISVIASIAIVVAKDGITDMGRSSIENTAKAVYNSISIQHDLLKEKLITDIQILEKTIKAEGDLFIDKDFSDEVVITDQITKNTSKINLPTLYLDRDALHQSTEIVDTISEMTKSMVTIFQYHEDKLIRVSTTVKNTSGNRAINTYITKDSPVYQSVMNGNTYVGKAFVVDDWYMTIYKPIKDSISGDVVAVLFLGKKILNDQLIQMVSETKAAEVGYFFIYNDKGDMLIHPTLAGKNLFEIPVLGELFKSHKGGFLEYYWDNDNKISHISHFKEWDWYIGVGLSESQMLRGVDTTIFKYVAMASVLLLLFGLVFSFLLVKVISKPLNDLAKKSIDVSTGDYTVSFTYDIDDDIGKLNKAMSDMVKKTKSILNDIISVTHTLSSASTELAAVSTQMTDSTKDAAKIAKDVNTASGEVSMHLSTVSAAMEEASINVSTVAAATEEMSATISEIAQNAEKAKQVSNTAVDTTNNTSGNIDKLAEAMKEISSITNAIAGISSQTNLLALNATIEAARAGSHGKGFAVVANEIKELANQAAKATEDIKDKIQVIQAITGVSVKDMKTVSGIIYEINDGMNTIATAVEEQSVTTRDIAENVSQVSAGVNEINRSVLGSVTMVNSISDNMKKVQSTTDEISESSGHVQSSANELSQIAEKLKSIVGYFKL